MRGNRGALKGSLPRIYTRCVHYRGVYCFDQRIIKMPDGLQSFATLPVLTPHPTFRHTNTRNSEGKKKVLLPGQRTKEEAEGEELIGVDDGSVQHGGRGREGDRKNTRRKLD